MSKRVLVTDDQVALFQPAGLERIASVAQLRFLLALGIEQFDESLADLTDVMARADVASVNRAAHRLAGSAVTIGAPAIADASQALCRLCSQGDAAALGSALARIRVAVDATAIEIRAYLARAEA